MTGFGNASQKSDAADVTVEIKSVNNRYLKLSVRLPDVVAKFESDLEKIIRDRIARGSVQVSVRVRFDAHDVGYALNPEVLGGYLRQVEALQKAGGAVGPPVGIGDLLLLPGVVSESEVSPEVVEGVWPLLKQAVEHSLDHFDDFRRREGESMRQDLKLQIQTISDRVSDIDRHAPEVVAEYREKLLERIRKAIGQADVTVCDSDVIREVAIYADRCDINEEITRLRSHIEQFHRFLDSDSSMGRKLEFLGQEMFREINTIGSKANNVTIAHDVVDMKAAIERIREVLQNVE